MTEGEALRPLDSLDPFLAAIRAHAEAIARAESIDEDELATRTDELRNAARVYAEEVYERSGWDNPFYDLFDEFDIDEETEDGDEYEHFGDEGDEDGDDVAGDDAGDDSEEEIDGDEDDAEFDGDDGDEDIVRLSVSARYDFVVRDEELLVNSVRDRLAQEVPEATQTEIEETVTDAIAAVSELFELDGWDPAPYDEVGLETAGTASEVDYVELTIFEEEDDEDLVEDYEDDEESGAFDELDGSDESELDDAYSRDSRPSPERNDV